jgi:hypothetical protein
MDPLDHRDLLAHPDPLAKRAFPEKMAQTYPEDPDHPETMDSLDPREPLANRDHLARLDHPESQAPATIAHSRVLLQAIERDNRTGRGVEWREHCSGLLLQNNFHLAWSNGIAPSGD